MLPADSSLHRFLAYLRGEAEGSAFERVRFYGFRAIMGAIIGFFIVAMATPSRDHRGEGFSLEIYFAGIAAGAVLMLAVAILARLLRPKDWPTREEFRRGGNAKANKPD
jgi:hypothetical protein